MRIFLADLGHNLLTRSSDVYPLGIANLATYSQANFDRPETLDITLFREPQDLQAALGCPSPEVVGFSSYAWNHNLSLALARYAKAKNPRVLTLMGGPNFPLTVEEQETLLRSMPEIDVAVRGPTYEGERAFLNIIRRFSDAGHSLEGLREEAVPANLWIDPQTGEFVRGAAIERIRDLDEIPSPYLAGYMDPFFATGYFPMMQISRGCPFSCAFCNSSAPSNSKIYRHSVENVKADLVYIAERVRSDVTLCFADDNFGMYEWDEEIADYFGYLQDRYGWPNYIRTTTGKNKHERIIRVMRKARGMLPMTAAVQSLNPVVLQNIARSNISLQSYVGIQQELTAQGMQAYGELILCLPGETKASFLQAVRDLMESGVRRISAHQLMLLHGAPLSNPESRQRWGFQTRLRVVARNIGNYVGEPVIETEEMVVATPTFSFQDYLETRVFHLLTTIFYYEGNFEEAFELAREGGVKPFDLVLRLQSLLEQAPAAFQALMGDFLRESQEELFESREACLEWARQNFDGLVDGTLGGNLLSKYSMLGRFYLTREALDFLELCLAKALGESPAAGIVDLIPPVMRYLRGVTLHAPFAESLAATPDCQLSHDVEAWGREGYSQSLEAYRYPEMRVFATAIDPKVKASLESKIATFGEHPSGLGKFTRTMFAQDLRRKLNPKPDGCPARRPFPSAVTRRDYLWDGLRDRGRTLR